MPTQIVNFLTKSRFRLIAYCVEMIFSVLQIISFCLQHTKRFTRSVNFSMRLIKCIAISNAKIIYDLRSHRS